MVSFIDAHRKVYGVEPICRVLPASGKPRGGSDRQGRGDDLRQGDRPLNRQPDGAEAGGGGGGVAGLLLHRAHLFCVAGKPLRAVLHPSVPGAGAVAGHADQDRYRDGQRGGGGLFLLAVGGAALLQQVKGQSARSCATDRCWTMRPPISSSAPSSAASRSRAPPARRDRISSASTTSGFSSATRTRSPISATR